MIEAEQITKIRHLYYGEHWKIGTIAADLGLHHQTVREALETDRFNRPQRLCASKIDPYMDFTDCFNASSSQRANSGSFMCL
jgi:DNA-binding transcriptional regulator LsrR (DeoR family)